MTWVEGRVKVQGECIYRRPRRCLGYAIRIWVRGLIDLLFDDTKVAGGRVALPFERGPRAKSNIPEIVKQRKLRTKVVRLVI